MASDPLTSLPAELLIKIIAHLPLNNFLDVSRASSKICQFMKTHAAAICNTSLRINYPARLELLQAELQEGWLVPKHPKLLASQVFKEKIYYIYRTPFQPWLFRHKLSLPGPQFLYILPRAVAPSSPKASMAQRQKDLLDALSIALSDLWLCRRHVCEKPRVRELIWYYGAPDK